MFDILVYLFENYIHPTACPASDQLARKLSAVGFEDNEISEALEWLADLRQISVPPLLETPREGSLRVYAAEEEARLDAACRGFLCFLESAGIVDTAMRELIIERALALNGFNINLHRFKIIVLIVLWQQDRTPDSLVLDELLASEGDEAFTSLH